MGKNSDYAAGATISMEELGLINDRKKLRIARKRARRLEERETHVKHEPHEPQRRIRVYEEEEADYCY